jgi:hypothetical protein
VIELLATWRFERVNLTALRIDAGHNMLNDAILTRRIDSLKDNQHRPAVLCIEYLLELGQGLNSGGKVFFNPRFVL